MSLGYALRNTTVHFEDPFLHYLIDKPLTEGMLDEICRTEIADAPRLYDGTRAGDAGGVARNANTRSYVTHSNCHEFPALTQLVEDLLSRETIETVEDQLSR